MLEFTRTEYENLKKSKELDEFSPAQFHAWINSNEDLFMKGESGEFDDDLQKSEYNTLQNELAAFVKVGVWEEDKQSTIVKSEYFIREKQVDFTEEIQKSENGEDEKIIKGIYRDTALNRHLNRVGADFGSQIEKSRAGTYEDTPENRKLGRVGQRYGKGKEGKEKIDSDISSLRSAVKDIISLKNSTERWKKITELGIGSVKELPMGSGGVGQIKHTENEYRIQISHGHGRYNYADTWVIPKSEIDKLK